MIQPQLTRADVQAMISARTVEDLVAVALRIIDRLHLHHRKKVSLVCGPITTGNQSTPEDNRRRLQRVAAILQRQDVLVFEHFLFFRRLAILQANLNIEDPEVVRDSFDLPILKSGKVETIYLTGEWLKSHGSRWYHDRAKDLGISIKIVQIPRKSSAAFA